MVPTNFNTTYCHKCLMNVITLFITDTKPSVLMQPRQTTLNHPAVNPKPTAIFGSTLGKKMKDSPASKLHSVWLTIISPVSKKTIRTLNRPAYFAGDWRNAINQRQQLRDIVTVGTGQPHRKGDAIGICYHMMFRAPFAAICGVWACFCPPKTARTDDESTTAREKSIWSACRNLLSRTWCILSQTPSCCQSRNLRQQVIPEPQPISLGKSSQPIPVFSTNNIPVSTARFGMGFRPGYRNLRFLLGISGSMISHNLSSTIGFAISSLRVFQGCRATYVIGQKY